MQVKTFCESLSHESRIVPGGNCSGVYIILNKQSGRFYIGRSSRIRGRFLQHKTGLINGDHENQGMQEDFDLYGSDSFIYSVFQEAHESELVEMEKRLIEAHIGDGCYNLMPGRPFGTTKPPTFRVQFRVTKPLQELPKIERLQWMVDDLRLQLERMNA